MNYIITESQQSLIRRMKSIEDEIHVSLEENDPCEYSRFEQYMRIVINEAISNVISDENVYFNNSKEIFDFRDKITPLFEEQIRDYYDIIGMDC